MTSITLWMLAILQKPCGDELNLKYVTQVRLAKRLTVDSYDELFDYLQNFEKLVNASRAKKLEKTHDPLVLVAHTGSSSRIMTPYYVTHPSSVADYDDDYQGDTVPNNYDDPLTSAMIFLARAITQNFSKLTNNHLRTSSNTRNQAIVQGDRVNIQSRNSGNNDRNTRRSYVQEEVVEGTNVQNDAGNIQRNLRTTSSGTATNVQCYNRSEKGHYARNCPKPKVWDSKYFMEQMLLEKQDEAGVILTDEHNDFLFADASRMEEIKELSANICLMARIQPANIDSDAGPSYDFAFLSEVQTPSTSYVNPFFVKDNLEQKYPMQPNIINNTIGNDQIDNNIIFDEPNDDDNNSSFEDDNNAQQSYELEQLARNVYREAEKQQIIAKNVKKNEDTMLKIGNSLQGMFMLGPKPMSFYDSKLKHGLGYANPYTLEKAISQNPKLYDAFCLDDSKIHMNVRDTEDILEDATKSQIKMKNKMKDPIAIQKKQNVCTIDYNKLNALYDDFVPQKELSDEQKYFPSSFISSEDHSNESSSYSSSETKPTQKSMPSANPILVDLNQMENDFQKLFELLEKTSKRESIFYTSPEEIRLNDFCQQQLKPILHELQFKLEIFQKRFLRDIKEMKDVFESTESDLSETWKQNELLKDQLLEATLKHEIECCVLLSHECVDNNMKDEIEKVQRDSIEIQEGMQKQINILENDVQRCQKQSLDFELQLQHEKEKRKCESSLKNVCETSWISKMEKLESENVSLECQVQSLIKEQDNVKTEYKKLFDSIKKTRAQTQGEINELIENVKQKTYAYADVRAQNQDLLMQISELRANLQNVEQGMRATSSVRRPSHRDSSFKNSVLSDTKNSLEKVKVSDRSYNKPDVASKHVALDKKIVTNDEIKNALIAKNVLCVTCAKNVLFSCHDNCLAKYKLNVRSNVRRSLFTTPRIVKSMFKDTTPVVSKTRFSVRTVQSKSVDTTSVVSKAKIDPVTPLSDKNKVSNAFTVRDNSLSNYMKNKIQTSRMWQKWYELQPNVGWSPVKKSLHVNNGRSTVVQIILWIVDSGCSKHMTGDRSLLKNFVEKFIGTVRFGNDHFAAITGYDNYVQGNITICDVYYVKGLGHSLFSVGQFCDGDLEVAFRSKTCYV
ncbi:retrovirus-related pol polyprotein from transposon TNT 1-94 [Tanacetum coccineum]|uniref:Retrovirus-related pol polyprotein from transposon TNT 1-94 n=1 Tax=Tanacetum coccineum TaxID=301880 RepID=A0ABQ5FAS3_9ASTR